jgi:hypothetical protein
MARVVERHGNMEALRERGATPAKNRFLPGATTQVTGKS